MRIRKTIFGRTKIKPNTFIGGVSAAINTPTLIANKLGISVSRIKAFSVIGSDIQFAVIGGNYNIPTSAFKNNTTITYFNDSDGLVIEINPAAFVGAISSAYYIFPNLNKIISSTGIGTGVFQNNSSLSSFTAPKLTTIVGDYTFSTLGTTATNLVSLNFPMLTGSLGANTFAGQGKLVNLTIGAINSIGLGCFSGNLKLKSFNCSHLTDVPDNAFNGCKELDSIVNMNLVLAIGQDSFRECYSLPNFSAISLVTLGVRSFYFTKSITAYYFPALKTINCGTSIGTGTFQNSWDVLTFNAPVLETINGNYCFNGWDKATNFYMPMLTTLGTSVGDNGHFGNIKTGATITVKSSLQTANAGAPDGDLVYASGNRGAIIVYV